MLSLDVLLISSLLAMPLSPVQQEPPTPPEPPAQPEPEPEPAPEPEPEPEPEPQAEPAPEPMVDEPPSDPSQVQSERERQLEEELAEARARAADLERMIDTLRQQVTQLRAELAARAAAQTAATPAQPSAPSAPSRSRASETSEEGAAKVPPQRSWDEDPGDTRPSWTPPASAVVAAQIPATATSDPAALLSTIRSTYSARFPSIPSPGQRDAFDSFSADVVKWSASQQRALRMPVTWKVHLIRVEKGSAKDRTVRFIARGVSQGGPRGAGDTFVVRIPRGDAEELMKGDYRSGPYEVTGTLAPIVRFAPERAYDGISSTHSAFVGPYCEVSIAVDGQSIRPGS